MKTAAVKKLLAVILMSTMVFTAFGCAKKNESAESTTVPKESYAKDGWTVVYDPQEFSVNEEDDGASFVYQGEAAGTSMVTIKYVEGKQPEEALTELCDEYGITDTCTRSEGIFPGTDSMWGYWRMQQSNGDDSGLNTTLIGGEYENGTLIFEILAHMGEDDGQNSNMNDALSGIIDSIEYAHFDSQPMYDYIPGTYEQHQTEELADGSLDATYSVVLNKDHTGSITFQDTIDVTWGSTELMREDDPDEKYEYTIEGTTLYLNYDGNWLEFEKRG